MDQLTVCYYATKEACASADALLFQLADQSAIDRSCRESPIGKLTHEALYVHVSALTRLSPLLRVYEEEHGLFADPVGIGTRKHWNELLCARGLTLCGHSLVKVTNAAGALSFVARQPQMAHGRAPFAI